MDQLLAYVETLVGASWAATAVMVAIILLCTAVVSKIATRFVRGILAFNEDKNLPSTTIFVNIVRGAVWILGLCIMLDTCFGVNVSAIIAALGVTGIAISLGFQDTLSNLIGGLQVSLMRIVKPGDNIEVGSSMGVVQDVTWRHTTIINTSGETVIIPNSIINNTALVQLPPLTKVKIPVVVATGGEQMEEISEALRKAATLAAESIGAVEEPPQVLFSSVDALGFSGSIVFFMKNSEDVFPAKDAVVRAIAPLTRGDKKHN